jgi:hypothetical protein
MVAWATIATLSKVNSRAMTARQPSVPNFIVCNCPSKRCIFKAIDNFHRSMGQSQPFLARLHLTDFRF